MNAEPNAHPPRRFYGWTIAVTLAITQTISWGVLYYSISVFLTPMEADLGWTRAELTGAFSLMWLVAGVMAFPVGAWVDKHGGRALMTIGSVGAMLLVIAWSHVETLPAFYAIWAGLGVCAAAVLYEPAFAILAQWFMRRRGTALAIVTFAAGLSSTIFLPLTDALLHALGWRGAVLALALGMGAVTIPLHAGLLRRRPADLGQTPDGLPPLPAGAVARADVPYRAALRGRAFWLLTLAFGLIGLSGAAIRIHFIPLLIDTGLDPSTAAAATGVIGVTQVIGRVLFAPLDRRFSAHSIALGMFTLQAAVMGVLLLGQPAPVIALFILGFGAAQGVITLSRPSILAEQYGVSNYGRISSIMALFLTLISTGAPLLASLLYDRAGSYAPVLWLVFVCALAGCVVIAIARRAAALRD